jgi:hypothetical protein
MAMEGDWSAMPELALTAGFIRRSFGSACG